MSDGHSFKSYTEQYGQTDDPRYIRNLFEGGGLIASGPHRATDYAAALHRAFDLRHGITSHHDFQRHLTNNPEIHRMLGPHGPAAPQLVHLSQIQREAIKEERERIRAMQLTHAKEHGYKLFGAK